MFLSSIKYRILENLRTKEVLIWMILFPVILGTLYKFTFGSIYSKTGFTAVPTAVVENVKDNTFHVVMDAMNEADSPILDITYCSEEEAYAMLENGDVCGIIFIDAPSDTAESDADSENGEDIAAFLKQYLTNKKVAAFVNDNTNAYIKELMEFDNGYLEKIVEGYSGGSLIPKTRLSLKIRNNGMQQTMLKKTAEMYQSMQKAGRDIMEQAVSGNGSNGDAIAKAMQGGAVVEQLTLTKGNTDPFAAYMYNLIAMVAIFGSMSGLTIASSLQANLSAVGARRECSGAPKIILVLSSLIGYYIAHSFCVAVGITFVTFVLRTDFGNRLPLVYLAGILGGIMGVSLGFFIGAIGKISYGIKAGLVMALNMTCCFMSGLMLGDMKAILEQNAPIVNDLNPAAIVCDAFYYLSVDASLDRYLGKLLAMGIFTVVFVLLGFIMTRRRKYASL